MRLLAVIIAALMAVTTAMAETYVVCVGIGSYSDPRMGKLVKTEKDAAAVAAFYRKATDNVITITGRYATKEQILKSLRSQFNRAKTGDKIVFFFSGHGYPGGFCPYDMSSLDGGLTFAEVIGIMAHSHATDKMIFADACNSGSMRRNYSAPNPEPGNILLFLSSRGNESSIESSLVSNGYFTNYLLHGLRGKADADYDRAITAKELYDYVSAGVSRLSKGTQHPVMWGSFPDNLVIVRYRRK